MRVGVPSGSRTEPRAHRRRSSVRTPVPPGPVALDPAEGPDVAESGAHEWRARAAGYRETRRLRRRHAAIEDVEHPLARLLLALVGLEGAVVALSGDAADHADDRPADRRL